MLATTSFDHVINEIQRSGLNFQLQISPFSALISLRKSLIKDVSGKPLIPSRIKPEPESSDFTSEQFKALVSKNIELEKELKFLTTKYQEVTKDVKIKVYNLAN